MQSSTMTTGTVYMYINIEIQIIITNPLFVILKVLKDFYSAGLTVSRSGASTPVTPAKPASGNKIT